MGSLKFHFAPLFYKDRAGKLSLLATPRRGRNFSQDDWDVFAFLSKRDMWAGLDLPPHKQTDDAEIFALVIDPSEEENDEYFEEDE